MRLRHLALVIVAAAFLLPAGAQANDSPPVPDLHWTDCAEGGWQCATAEVPKDYAKPRRGTITLALTKLPASDPSKRIGSLFINFGGPGGTTVDTLQAIGASLFGSLTDRFDIVGFDPRGVGQSVPSIDCRANQETEGVYRKPFTTPDNLDVKTLIEQDADYINRCLELNKGILPYVSTANVARDMDLLREAVGDEKLNYLGYSYGTFLGATYLSMFPGHTRAAVLDGALDPDQYVNDPLGSLDEQSAGFERALNRFMQACASDQVACLGFGGRDPLSAFDQMVEKAYDSPIPVTAGDDLRPLDGDDVLAAAALATYSKGLWPLFAQGLAEVAAPVPDGSTLRILTDAFYGWLGPDQYDPITDRYFTIGALEQRYTSNVKTYLYEGKRSFQDYDHFWFNHGYVELAWGLYPVRPRGVFYGPFHTSDKDPTTLVVGTRYDPATPYKQAKRMVAQLGNARLLTMWGDGHTAYGGESACIDAAVDAYLEESTVPDKGTVCPQDTPFAQAQAKAVAERSAVEVRRQFAPRIAR